MTADESEEGVRPSAENAVAAYRLRCIIGAGGPRPASAVSAERERRTDSAAGHRLVCPDGGKKDALHRCTIPDFFRRGISSRVAPSSVWTTTATRQPSSRPVVSSMLRSCSVIRRLIRFRVVDLGNAAVGVVTMNVVGPFPPRLTRRERVEPRRTVAERNNGATVPESRRERGSAMVVLYAAAPCPGRFRYTVSFVRPLARLRARTLRPDLLRIRNRNPCFLVRFAFFGLYRVTFIRFRCA